MASKFCSGGNNKSRMSYDNLSWCQWVLGFTMIAREENNIETKNAMLDYRSEIMEDANDFSWQSAKASHSVLLCRMEEGKIEWSDTIKIDRIRRVKMVCKESKEVKKGHSTIHIGQNEFQDEKKAGPKCQKHAKLCPDTGEDKYDLSLQVKIQNKDRF